eukprot:CAMPEP_0174264626 /NCGR_PEP_ID=MMETSP0439-20130205/23186_1 /TAXON_ID=0 /ORGANISM="Stereomyxa ramosa, Strain Chinc5" /LENGTH=115 /DNA_ID=CAMNT_0015350607 /DNA_START=66 /DNA_END=409 /DNA_ORIENTATION=+
MGDIKMVGRAKELEFFHEKVANLGKSGAQVFLLGESGMGKISVLNVLLNTCVEQRVRYVFLEVNPYVQNRKSYHIWGRLICHLLGINLRDAASTKENILLARFSGKKFRHLVPYL